MSRFFLILITHECNITPGPVIMRESSKMYLFVKLKVTKEVCSLSRRIWA